MNCQKYHRWIVESLNFEYCPTCGERVGAAGSPPETGSRTRAAGSKPDDPQSRSSELPFADQAEARRLRKELKLVADDFERLLEKADAGEKVSWTWSMRRRWNDLWVALLVVWQSVEDALAANGAQSDSEEGERCPACNGLGYILTLTGDGRPGKQVCTMCQDTGSRTERSGSANDQILPAAAKE